MVLLFTLVVIGFGLYSLANIPIGAVPDVTNNQVQVLTTTRNLSTQDVEQFITYPVELEMANLPGVKEIRSISKFGLSVVTIVFEDKMGTYLPRQLIAEKIKSAADKIPEGFGSPEMGPVTTGLGEIYQYILDVEPGFKDKYSTTELRSIQDWIVRRQLSGIPGVVEVNTWGGKLKQYEVAVDPNRLRAMNVSVPEVYEALQSNNSVAGAGYIEKTNQSFFIRGEGLVTSLEDIENIVVKNVEGMPVYVRDIATAQFGFATRFGAITANGEGEKVLGQVMMLKDADSKAVIERVKDRVAVVQESLPEGVFINPVLERSALIRKTTFTVAENLILGCLIVIFVVVLLLGNLRSGLVVASVIPLSLLFALSMMYLFGIDANLMSLGAIDFGIIIDGAVIIVEYVAYQIVAKKDSLLAESGDSRQGMLDDITFKSASKMMRPAVFGQLIIVIVFIPILSLSDVEGKMFQPMALTFCFALIGAMIMCFTYVPVAASIFLKPEKTRNFSSRLIEGISNIYTPSLEWALRSRTIVLAASVMILIGIGILFSRMGGEFVPTLDEGDFVIQPVLKTGTSLSKTIETTTLIETILKTFPEVDQVVTRIGAAEVPTDPMSMEETDVIITLRPDKEWTTATTKDGLADAFKDALTDIPGVDYEFTQPIEMRFNELITGVRADVAIKVFGEDLSILTAIGDEIADKTAGVEGAADISVEKIVGLPQMSVKYDRSKIARFGLNIEDVNRILTMSFGGLPAGIVFEGVRQFDLVVRYDDAYRKDIDNIRNSVIPLPGGGSIPLSEVADIDYSKGPAKISRDDTKRRIVVGINVRNRDLESVVDDVREIIDQDVVIPPGYSVSYGGQFENLQNARARLAMAVPLALILIFVMLFFAFKSFREALIVYTAIPFAAVGGVLLLYFRGLPFSISAGVGFIALFGIAVLNGIVLIEHFKELKERGVELHERIVLGTQQRLRPVLLTASAAALGFLPMAISTSAGAEVQRPLATVVIGGLITATLLTLIVLPVLYSIFDDRKIPIKSKGLAVLLILLIPSISSSQQSVTMEEAIEIALENNLGFAANSLEVDRRRSLLSAAFTIPKAQLYLERDESNLTSTGRRINEIGLKQSIDFPTVYLAQKSLRRNELRQEENRLNLYKRSIRKEVSVAYQSVLYWESVRMLFEQIDELYKTFEKSATVKFEQGESNYLEKLTASMKRGEIALKLEQSQDNILEAYQELRMWTQSSGPLSVGESQFAQLSITDSTGDVLGYFSSSVDIARSELSIAKSDWLPNFQFELFRGLDPGKTESYNGFQIGLGIPLWPRSTNANVKAARLGARQADLEYQNQRLLLSESRKTMKLRVDKLQRSLEFYQGDGNVLSDAITETASKAYDAGEIDFLQYTQLIENASNIKLNCLESLYDYNIAVLDLNYITVRPNVSLY